MGTYFYWAKFNEPDNHGSSAIRGFVQANSEDQAYDKVSEMIWNHYGWVSSVVIDVYEVE